MRMIYAAINNEEIPIEQSFVDYLDYTGISYLPLDHPFGTEIAGRSDHAVFQSYGIPSGGLFTGAESLKTADLVDLFGGKEGVAFDPCYHKECDTLENVNLEVLGQMAKAAAHTLYTFADMPNLNLTALALESTGGRRRLVQRSLDNTYMFDRKDDVWLR